MHGQPNDETNPRSESLLNLRWGGNTFKTVVKFIYAKHKRKMKYFCKNKFINFNQVFFCSKVSTEHR